MSDRITLFFEPLDVLLFRDHRPFDAGQHVWARSEFPRPSVFFGCVRAALLSGLGKHGADFDDPRNYGLGDLPGWVAKTVGGRDEVGRLDLRGPILARLKGTVLETFFVPPFDLLQLDAPAGAAGSGEVRLAIMKPKDLEQELGADRPVRFHLDEGAGASRVASALLPWSEQATAKEAAHDLLTRDGLDAWRAADAGDKLALRYGAGLVREREIFVYEDRVGIARDPVRHATVEGMFYVTRLFRLGCDCGFAVDVGLDDAQLADAERSEAEQCIRGLADRVVSLGGKGHRARIRVLAGPLLPEPDPAGGAGAAANVAPGATGCRVYLVTPALAGAEDASLRGGGRICTRIIDRPVLVGGFDLRTKSPRALRRALPPGTVLYLDGIGPAAGAGAIRNGQDDEDRRAGYGAALAGRWSKP